MIARHLSIAAVLLFVLISGAQAGGTYQRTKDGQSYVWNNYPKSGDEASWSGGTDSTGYAVGDGTLTWYKRGVLISRYTGRMVNGKFNGAVTNEDASGKKFRGTFVNGVKSADWTQVYDAHAGYATPTTTYSIPATTFTPAAVSPAQGNGSEYFDRALTEPRASKFEEALSDFNKAIELDPKNAQAYINRGIVQSGLGSAPGAEADFTRASDLDPRSSDAFYN